MKPNAIIYTSNTGFTAEYARLLSERTGLPAYSLANAPLSRGNQVIYLGWLMAGKVQGYRKAAKLYHISALCAVGMAPTGMQSDKVRKDNHVPAAVPVFTLQGGYAPEKLTGIYKLTLSAVVKALCKNLTEKADRTPTEDDTLALLTDGGSRVCPENLSGVLDWYALRN